MTCNRESQSLIFVSKSSICVNYKTLYESGVKSITVNLYHESKSIKKSKQYNVIQFCKPTFKCYILYFGYLFHIHNYIYCNWNQLLLWHFLYPLECERVMFIMFCCFMTPKINGQCHRNKYFISGFPNDNAFMYNLLVLVKRLFLK